MSSWFVDPRTHPDPPYDGVRRFPVDAEELHDLVALCRTGRIYAVEQWIKDDKPLFAESYRGKGGYGRFDSPMKVAIATKQYDLAVLLLCNGYPPDSGDDSLLSYAVEREYMPFIELLLAWGADPMNVPPHAVLDTYDSGLYERFWNYGVDLTKDHALARHLAEHSSNRPGYGWAKKHKDDPRIAKELGTALLHAVNEGSERSVALLVWAGADPHSKAEDMRWSSDDESERNSAVRWAAFMGRGDLLKFLKPDPALDDFDELWRDVCDVATMDYLAALRVPEDWSDTIICNIKGAVQEYSIRHGAMTCVERLFKTYKARLNKLDERSLKDLRRELVRSKQHQNVSTIVRFLKEDRHCDPTIYEELVRTPGMRAKLG